MKALPSAERGRVETFATEDLEAWRRHVSHSFVPLEVETDRPDCFRAELRANRIDRLAMFDVKVSRHSVVRTPELVARSRGDHFKLSLQLRGSTLLMQDGKEALLMPGDMALYDTTRPYSLVAEGEMRHLVVMFSAASIDLTAQDLGELTARRLTADRPMCQIVSPFLMRIATNLESLETVSAMRVAHTTVDLLTTLFAGELDAGPEGSMGQHRRLLGRIKRYIDANLDDAELTPSQVAAANYISVRQLHQIFRAEGSSVSTWIRTRRLERSRRMLCDPAYDGCSVSQVAARCGLPDAPHFSRAFKAAFGVSPKAFRSVSRINKPARA